MIPLVLILYSIYTNKMTTTNPKNRTAMNMVYALIDTNYITPDDILVLFWISLKKHSEKFWKMCDEVRDRYFDDMQTKDVDLDEYVEELSDKICEYFRTQL